MSKELVKYHNIIQSYKSDNGKYKKYKKAVLEDEIYEAEKKLEYKKTPDCLLLYEHRIPDHTLELIVNCGLDDYELAHCEDNIKRLYRLLCNLNCMLLSLTFKSYVYDNFVYIPNSVKKLSTSYNSGIKFNNLSNSIKNINMYYCNYLTIRLPYLLNKFELDTYNKPKHIIKITNIKTIICLNDMRINDIFKY